MTSFLLGDFGVENLPLGAGALVMNIPTITQSTLLWAGSGLESYYKVYILLDVF